MSTKKLKTYTLEFKQASAQLAAESEQSVSETARELGVGVSTLHAWIQKYYASKKVEAQSIIGSSRRN